MLTPGNIKSTTKITNEAIEKAEETKVQLKHFYENLLKKGATD